MQIVYTLSIFFALSLSSIVLAGDYTPGLVKKASEDTLPTDLKVSNATVHLMFENHQELSALNPKDSSLWTNSKGTIAKIKLALPTTDLIFKSALNSSSENYRFSASAGSEVSLEVYLGVKAQNYLLRAALLTKLGFQVPKTTHEKSITVSFTSVDQKNQFIEKCTQQFLPLGITREEISKRWLLEDRGLSLKINDVVIVKKENTLWDLSFGYMDRAHAQNSRAMNSLLLPYTLVDISESFNLIDGKIGSLVQGDLFFDYSASHELNPNTDDITWVAKRILALSENDFSEIVDFAGFPFEPSLLLYNKLLSRRNSLLKILHLEGEEYTANLRETSGESLRNGRLFFKRGNTQTYQDAAGALFYLGHSRKYAFGAFDNPLGFSKMMSYLKTTSINTAIELAVAQLDRYLLPQVDNSKEVVDEHFQKIVRAFLAYLDTGEEQDTSLGTKFVRFLDADVFVSKDISMGRLSGPGSTLFLNETIGVSVSTGLNMFSDALPKSIGLSGELSVGYHRTFTKFSKVSSIDNAVSIGFSRDLLGMVKSSFLGIRDNWKSLINQRLLKSMNEKLEVGESFVISDNFGFKAKTTAAISGVYVSPAHNALNIRRLYFYKNADNNIQVYQTSGPIQNIGIDFGMTQAFIPIINFNFKRTFGKTKTVVYKISPEFFTGSNLDLNSEAAKNSVEVSLIEHNFKQNLFGWSFLLLQRNFQDTKDSISVQNSRGAQKKIDVYRKHTFSNANPVQFSASLAATLIKEANQDVMNTIMQRLAIFRDNREERVEVQAEMNATSSLSELDNLYSSVRLNWSGLRIDRRHLNTLITNINRDAGREIFALESVQNTDSLVFYDMGISISVYNTAIIQLLDSRVQEIAEQLNQNPSSSFSTYLQGASDQKALERRFRARVRALREQAQACKQTLLLETNKSCLVNYIDRMKKMLTLNGFINLLGEENIFLTGAIDGVFYGDELGLTKKVYANQYGRSQGKYADGVINYVIRRESFNYSEFLLSGILGV